MTGRKLAQAAAIAATIVGAGAGLFAGCGGGGGGKTLTEADFCAQKAEAECQVTAICLTDATLCKMQRQTVCMSFATNAKASGKRVFVPGNVGDCISKTTAAYKKTSPITPMDMAGIDDACNYVFQGKGAVNVDMCDVKFDCANKVICDKGFCATQKNVNSACGNPGDVCPNDQYCAQNTSSVYVCMPKGMSGTACDAATKPCVDSLRCAGGSCTDRVASGGTCTSNADCVSTAPFCDPYAGNKCDLGLSFASGSPSCSAFGGTTGAGGTSGGTGGTGGSGGSGGGAGSGAGGSGGRGGGGGLGGLGGLGGVGGLTGLGGLGGTNLDAGTD